MKSLADTRKVRSGVFQKVNLFLHRRYHAAVFFLFIPLFFLHATVSAQCPVNIGFESGTFDKWDCVAGLIDTLGNITTSSTGPLTDKHTIYPRTSKELDRFGGFPVVCPNGSNYSIKLGNDLVKSEVDGVRYTFVIPPGQDDYSIIYNYAVVFQNPDHKDFQQPRFTAKVFDVSANTYIDCSSFDFAASRNLPGFKLSTVGATDDRFASIYYKPWSSVSIKLLGYAGKTVRLEFTVNDCSLSGHFGYAYFDVNEECGTFIKGNTLCNGVISSVLTAPYGFQGYTWYTSDFSQVLGKENILPLKQPLPPAGTKFALELIPFPGSGCRDTLYAKMATVPTPFVLQVVDTIGKCDPGVTDLTSAAITQGSTPGLQFSYFLDPGLLLFAPADSIAKTTRGTYYIKAVNQDGCLDVKSVVVKNDVLPDITVKNPAPVFYPSVADITDPSLINGNLAGLSFSYWKDLPATISVSNPKTLNSGGTYYIKATTKFGCSVVQPVEVSIQIAQPPNAFSPNNDGINDVWEIPSLAPYPQCTVDVYSRSGRLVFHSVGYNQPWDGKMNGKLLPLATYYFVIKGADNLKPVSGSVTLIY